jgi:hypothetical protein
MHTALKYCVTRRSLEERGWILTSKLASASARLMKLVGKDHEAFMETRAECKDLRMEIVVSRTDLRDHRAVHRC